MAQDGRGSRPGRPPEKAGADPNTRLLLWRLVLAILLTVSSLILYNLGSTRVVGPGLVGALGLLYTSIAAAWAATMAGAPQRPLLATQLGVDAVAIGLMVHFSGGPYSAFPLMFCVPIVLAARYHGQRGALAMAGAAAAFTGGGHFGLALGRMASGSGATGFLEWWPVSVTSLHMAIFLVTGLIAGDMVRRGTPDDLGVMRRPAGGGTATRRELRSILDNIRSGLLTVNRRGRITRINPAGCRILGLAEQHLLGRELGLVTAGGLEPLADMVTPVAQGGDPVSRAEVTVRRAGQEIPLGLNVNHLAREDGETVGAIAVFTDLTKEKELSARVREADRLAAVGELAASIAHEIRNPLASIRGSVEILAGELDLADYQGQLLDLVLKESARVNTIINDFLAYSRMRPAERRRFSGHEFRDEITLQIRQHIAAKDGQVRVACDINPDDLEVSADPGQLTQMALNLAINACEAMAYQGVLRISLNKADGGEACELVVQDNGPGIDPEIAENLFRPFKTTKEGGTGLGLSIVARIATAHGGSVRAQENPGGGSIFLVRWPQQDPDPFIDRKTSDEPEFSPVSAS